MYSPSFYSSRGILTAKEILDKPREFKKLLSKPDFPQPFLYKLLREAKSLSFCRYIHKDILKTFNFALNSVKINGLMLKYLGEFKDNPTVVEAAIMQNGYAMRYASRCFQYNFTLALKAVKSNGLAIQFIKPDFVNNPKIAEAAVAQDPHAYRYVGEKFKLEKIFTLSVIKREPSMIHHIPNVLRKDDDILSLTLR